MTREYSDRPIVGVAGVVIFRGKVLLIRRGHEPLKGSCSVPGGALRLGEHGRDGVVREVREETGILVRPLELIEVLDRVLHDVSGRVQYHYVLLDWFCVVEPGGSGESHADPISASDAVTAVWADLRELDVFKPDHVTLRVIQRAEDRAEELKL